MKKWVLIFIVVIGSLSCNKNTNNRNDNNSKSIDTCTGHFIGLMVAMGRPGLFGMDTTKSTNSLYPYYAHFEENTIYSKIGVYDNRRKHFYTFINRSNYIDFCQYSFLDNTKIFYKYFGLISIGNPSALSAILCDTKANKVYCVHKNTFTDNIDRIVELSFSGDTCRDIPIFVGDTQTALLSPVIDENTGHIYFMDGSSLKKVDPENSVVSVVKTYSGIHPRELHFNQNDGMFYGIDTEISPYSFLKINPENGSVLMSTPMTSVVSVIVSHTFDVCHNRYILFAGDGMYYVNPENGKAIKTEILTAPLTYIEVPLKK